MSRQQVNILLADSNQLNIETIKSTLIHYNDIKYKFDTTHNVDDLRITSYNVCYTKLLRRGSLVVQAANPASMLNVILYSPQDPGLPPQWRKRMEEFQYILDDDEIAAVASYIRNSWGQRAGPVAPDQVARQR